MQRNQNHSNFSFGVWFAHYPHCGVRQSAHLLKNVLSSCLSHSACRCSPQCTHIYTSQCSENMFHHSDMGWRRRGLAFLGRGRPQSTLDCICLCVHLHWKRTVVHCVQRVAHYNETQDVIKRKLCKIKPKGCFNVIITKKQLLRGSPVFSVIVLAVVAQYYYRAKSKKQNPKDEKHGFELFHSTGWGKRGGALTHFTVFSCEPVWTHTSIAPRLLLTRASIAAGTRGAGIESNWKETGRRESVKRRPLWFSFHSTRKIFVQSKINSRTIQQFSHVIFYKSFTVLACITMT